MIEELLSAVYGSDEQDPKRAFAYGVFMDLLEPTVEDLTKDFLAASGVNQEFSSGRLQKAIEQEIGDVSSE